MPAKKLCKTKKGHAVTPPCPPLKEQSQDYQQGQGIRDTPLVPGGTVADLMSMHMGKLILDHFEQFYVLI